METPALAATSLTVAWPARSSGDRRGTLVLRLGGVSVQAGPIDLATPSGQMVARQLGAVAQYESAIKAERLRSKMEQKADNGEWMGGPVPFGWRRIGTEKGRGRLELEPAEAELIATGTRALLDGASMYSLTRAWEASGVPARHGPRINDHWSRRSVLLILKRWRNAGVHEHRGEPTPDRPADWSAIPGVSIDDVRAVRELLAERAPGHTFDSNPKHLLSGIARCPCGAVMRAGSAPKGRGRRSSHTYRCVRSGPGHVSRGSAPIDELVRAVIVERLRQPDVADLIPAADPAGPDVPELRATVRKERKRLDELAVMLADGDLDRGSYRTARDRVNERLSAAETALTAAYPAVAAGARARGYGPRRRIPSGRPGHPARRRAGADRRDHRAGADRPKAVRPEQHRRRLAIMSVQAAVRSSGGAEAIKRERQSRGGLAEVRSEPKSSAVSAVARR